MRLRSPLIALLVVSAWSCAGDASSVPPAVTPEELLQSAIDSPGDGSDVLKTLADFESAEAWRNAPAGMVVSKRGVEAILNAEEKSAPAKSNTASETVPE